MFWYSFYRRYIWLLRVIVVFFMGFIVAGIIALHQINLETLRGNILSMMRDASNLPVEIDGDISWKFSLRPEIELNDIRITNADWAKNKDFFYAKKIDVRLDLFSLFRARPVIRYVTVIDAKINLEKNANGKDSIVFNSDEKEDVVEKSDTKKLFPFEKLPFGGLEIHNLTANIYGDKYTLASLGIRNYMHDNFLEYSGWIRPYDSNLPFVVKFSEYNAERKIYPVRIAVATGGRALIADVALEGTSKLPIDFVVHGDVPNLKKSGDWLNWDLMTLPNMNVNISGGIDGKKFVFRKSSISIGESGLTFSGTYDWSKKTPVLVAKFSSDKIDLYKSFPEWFGAGVEWVHPNRDLNVFHDMPLGGKFLYDIDMNLDVNVKHFIVYRSLDLSDLKLKANVKNHKLRADAKVMIANGEVKAVIDADIDENGVYTAQAAAVGENITIGEILNQIREYNVISGLPSNLDLYVRANGADMSQIMQTITGPVIVYSVDRGFAHADLVEYMYGGDFLTALRHNVEDLFTGKKRDMIQINSAIANLKLRNGLIETRNGVAVETMVINMRLAGDLDLGKETISLSLASVPVRGLKLSLSGNVVNSLQISGNLAEPDFKINGAAIAGKVGSAVGLGLLLAPLTGGLSIAGGFVAGLLAGDLLEGWLADDNPYKTAMEKGAPVKYGDPEWFQTPVKELAQPLFESYSL